MPNNGNQNNFTGIRNGVHQTCANSRSFVSEKEGNWRLLLVMLVLSGHFVSLKFTQEEWIALSNFLCLRMTFGGFLYYPHGMKLA